MNPLALRPKIHYPIHTANYLFRVYLSPFISPPRIQNYITATKITPQANSSQITPITVKPYSPCLKPLPKQHVLLLSNPRQTLHLRQHPLHQSSQSASRDQRVPERQSSRACSLRYSKISTAQAANPSRQPPSTAMISSFARNDVRSWSSAAVRPMVRFWRGR